MTTTEADPADRPYTHCDDLINDPSTPETLRDFLAFHRQPAIQKHGDGPTLFATVARDIDWAIDGKPISAGTRVKVVMASRFGDVGITTNLEKVRGYQARVGVDELKDFSS